MDGLAPILQLLFEVQLRLSTGQSLQSILQSLKLERGHNVHSDTQKILWAFRNGQSPPRWTDEESPQRQAFYEILWSGLQGEPCLEALRRLQPELIRAAERDVDQFLKRTPVWATLIVMGLCVPALLILVFGLLMEKLLSGGVL
jgi:hypothetical protein